MEKGFTDWHALKEELHGRKDAPPFFEREIWWCSIGVNIGYEQDGKNGLYNRPVLVVRKFSRELFLGVPLTTRIKDIPHYHRMTFKGHEQCAMLMQTRAWSSRRLANTMGKLAEPEFEKVKAALRAML